MCVCGVMNVTCVQPCFTVIFLMLRASLQPTRSWARPPVPRVLSLVYVDNAGCGFIVFKDPASAEAAMHTLHEKRTIPGVRGIAPHPLLCSQFQTAAHRFTGMCSPSSRAGRRCCRL